MAPKKVINNAFLVSSNNESQFPSKNTAFLGSFAYKSSFNLITLKLSL